MTPADHHSTSNSQHPAAVLHSLWRQNNPLVLLALDHLERLQKVLPARLHRRRVLLVRRQVGVDEFDQAVEVFGCDLSRVMSVFVQAAIEGGGGGGIPTRSSDRNNTHIDPESRQTARWTWPSPCTSPPRGGPAGDIPGRASHRGTTVYQGQVSDFPGEEGRYQNSRRRLRSPRFQSWASPTTNDWPSTRRGTGRACAAACSRAGRTW